MLTNTLGRDEGVYWAQAATFTLEAHKAGSGGGTITANSAISCAADECSGDFADPTDVTLTATPGANSTFAGWSGDCTGTGACTVRMSGPREVTATFGTVPPTPSPPPPLPPPPPPLSRPRAEEVAVEEAVAGSGPTCTSSSPRAPRLRHPSVPNSISS
jgi:Divergent InlB B-repeat domain